MLFPALEREELLPLPLLLDSGQRCLDPPPESMGAFGRLFAFLHAFAHPAPAAAEALRLQCGGGTAELWLQCGGGGLRCRWDVSQTCTRRIPSVTFGDCVCVCLQLSTVGPQGVCADGLVTIMTGWPECDST